jgi:thiol-disulfide isomerase/thioredoxin
VRVSIRLSLLLLFTSCVTLGNQGFVFEGSGTRLSLAELRGRVVVVNYWAEWCPACVDEFPALASMVAEAGKDAVLVPAYWAERPRNRGFFKWLEAQPAWFRERVCWADASVRASEEFTALPVTVVYGRRGEVVQRFVGSVDGRPTEFRDALRRALETKPEADAGSL